MISDVKVEFPIPEVAMFADHPILQRFLRIYKSCLNRAPGSVPTDFKKNSC